MIVALEVGDEQVYLRWVTGRMSHIVRDINEAKVYSEVQARKLQKRFLHKNAKLIRRPKNIERKSSI